MGSGVDTTVEIELLDPGVEPRRELRYAIPDDTTETLVMSQTIELQQDIGGVESPANPPVTTVTLMLISVPQVDDLYRIVRTVISAGSGEGMDQALKAQLDETLVPMVGIATVSLMNDRGVVIETGFEDESQLDAMIPMMRGAMEDLGNSTQVGIPLLEQAVGVGARWQLTRFLTVNGLETRSTQIVEIVNINASMIEFEVVQTDQVVGDEMDVEGVIVRILASDTSGELAIGVDLNSPISTITSSVTSDQLLAIERGGQEIEIDQTVTMTMTVERASSK